MICKICGCNLGNEAYCHQECWDELWKEILELPVEGHFKYDVK